MSQRQANPLLKIIIVLVVIFVVGLGLVALINSGNNKTTNTKKAIVVNDATGDTPVETLKTLTATVSQVEEQNKKILNDNAKKSKQAQEKLLQFEVKLKSQMTDLIHQKQPGSQSKINELESEINQLKVKQFYPIDTHNPMTAWVWVSDMSHPTLKSVNKGLKDQFGSILHDQNDLNNPKKPPVKPYYTLPVNATLTGAVLMQPIIGRVPVNGTVPDPYHFKVILGRKNFAANGIDIPPAVSGIVASGVATGDMLGSCARGQITAMTFVFQDGRISTTQAQQGQYLGTIASANGNPCIHGSFHSNAPMFFAGTSVLAGLQGYANALSAAQTVSTTSMTGGPTISTLVHNGNRYALGQGVSSFAQTAQRWWQQRVQNSFDYVFVSNVDNSEPGHLRHININITHSIDIDYNPRGRKVSYVNNQAKNINQNLD